MFYYKGARAPSAHFSRERERLAALILWFQLKTGIMGNVVSISYKKTKAMLVLFDYDTSNTWMQILLLSKYIGVTDSCEVLS